MQSVNLALGDPAAFDLAAAPLDGKPADAAAGGGGAGDRFPDGVPDAFERPPLPPAGGRHDDQRHVQESPGREDMDEAEQAPSASPDAEAKLKTAARTIPAHPLSPPPAGFMVRQKGADNTVSRHTGEDCELLAAGEVEHRFRYMFFWARHSAEWLHSKACDTFILRETRLLTCDILLSLSWETGQ
jgi:hypothetical protein